MIFRAHQAQALPLNRRKCANAKDDCHKGPARTGQRKRG